MGRHHHHRPGSYIRAAAVVFTTALCLALQSSIRIGCSNNTERWSGWVFRGPSLQPCHGFLTPPRRPRTSERRVGTNDNRDTPPETVLLQRGVQVMREVMTNEFMVRNAVLHQVLAKPIGKLVEVRPSTIPGAGRGLFAKKNIKANTIIGFYPCHALGVDRSNSNNKSDDDVDDTAFFAWGEEHQEYFQAHDPSMSPSPYLLCTDQPLFVRPSLLQMFSSSTTTTSSSENKEQQQPQKLLYLNVNPNANAAPNNNNNHCWVSHMINDGATIIADDTRTTEAADLVDYFHQSAKARNCIHIPFGPSPILATVTTQKIQKGSEILTTYGSAYWLGMMTSSSSSPDGRRRRNEDDAVAASSSPAVHQELVKLARELQALLPTVQTIYQHAVTALHTEYAAVWDSAAVSSSSSSRP